MKLIEQIIDWVNNNYAIAFIIAMGISIIIVILIEYKIRKLIYEEIVKEREDESKED